MIIKEMLLESRKQRNNKIQKFIFLDYLIRQTETKRKKRKKNQNQKAGRRFTSLSVVAVMVSIMWRTRWLWNKRSLLLDGSFWSSFTMSRSSRSTSSWPARVTSNSVDDIFAFQLRPLDLLIYWLHRTNSEYFS